MIKRILFFVLCAQFLHVSAQVTSKHQHPEFDEQRARQNAIKKGVPARAMNEYLESARRRFEEKHTAAHKPKQQLITYAEVNTNRIIGHNSIQATTCPNSDFSSLDYSNWTGDISTSCGVGTTYPSVTWNSSGFNGNNGTPIQLNNSPCNNSTGYHVIHSTPIGALSTVAATAFANGYDDNCKNPNTGFYDLTCTPSNGVNSIRLGSAYSNETNATLRFPITVTSANAQFTYQFAVVIDDGGHPSGEQPSFLFGINDVNGNLVTGVNQNCVQYNIDATAAITDTSYIKANGPCSGWDVYYRKWRTVTVDLTSQIGNTVYADFTVIDCPWGGHYCYAYISATCGNLTASVSGFCGGVGSATMQAPPGFANYQWYGPNNTTPIPGATGAQYTANPATNGDVYTVDCITLQGCTTKLSVTVSSSNILAVANTTPSCFGGSSGTASVSVSGGTQYSYTWTPGNFTTPGITGQPAGNYSVTVHDLTGNCPDTTLPVTIGNTTPNMAIVTDTVCGSTVTINGPSPGTNYTWTSDSLTGTVIGNSQNVSVTGPVTGDVFYVQYTNPNTGCTELQQVTLTVNTINFTPISTNPCTGGNTGSIQLNPSQSNSFSSYSYGVTSTNTLSVAYPTASSGTISLPAVSAGTYSILVTEPGNPTCFWSTSITLTGTGIPPAVLDTLFGCANDVLSLSSGTGTTHQWYSSSTGTTLISTNPVYTVTPIVANTVYTDTMANAQGCKSVYKVLLKVRSFKVVITAPEKIRCHDDSTGKLKVTANQEINGPLGTPYTFIWNYPSPYPDPAPIPAGVGVPQSSQVNNLHAGTYTCTVTSGNCVATATYNLVNPPLLPHDSLFASYCPKDSIVWLYAEPGHSTYNWFNASTGLPVTPANNNDSLQVTPQTVGDYWVMYTVATCRDTARILFTTPSYNAFRPTDIVNIFTPNGDQKNDYFYPFPATPTMSHYQIDKQMEDYEMIIYNRWGKKVFETNSYAKPWDGKVGTEDQSDGTFYYILRYKSNCSTKGDITEKHGYVQLLR